MKEIMDIVFKVGNIIREMELCSLIYSEETYEDSVDDDMIVII